VLKDNGGQRNDDIEKLIKDLGKKWILNLLLQPWY
jgi:hypothetical protein